MGIYRTYVEVICATCGKLFNKRKHEYEQSELKGGLHFCSRACVAKKYAGTKRKIKEIKLPKKELELFVDLICENCNKAFKKKACRA